MLTLSRRLRDIVVKNRAKRIKEVLRLSKDDVIEVEGTVLEKLPNLILQIIK